MAAAGKILKFISFVEKAQHADELRGKLIRADDALRCCHSSESKIQGRTTKIIGQYLQAVLAAKLGEAIAFVPAAGFGRIVVVTEAQAGQIAAGSRLAGGALTGAIIILGAQFVADIAGQTATLEAIAGLGNAIGQDLDKQTEDSCYECMRKKILSQSRPRQWQSGRIYRRI